MTKPSPIASSETHLTSRFRPEDGWILAALPVGFPDCDGNYCVSLEMEELLDFQALDPLTNRQKPRRKHSLICQR
jgi:hypothetical protein